eukprot:gene13531-13657_t
MGSIQDGSVYGHEVAAWETALHPDQVEHNLFISSGFTEAELDVLQMHGISHILQVGYELQPHHPGVFQYTQLDLADSFDADIVQYLPAAFTFITNGMQHGGKVLVHCVHGQSRSVAVVVAFLMWRDGKSYRECLELLKAARPRAAPNAGMVANTQRGLQVDDKGLLQELLWQSFMKHQSSGDGYEGISTCSCLGRG